MKTLKTFRELVDLLGGLSLECPFKFEYEYARGCFLKSYEVEIQRSAEGNWEIEVIVNERYGAVVNVDTLRGSVALTKVDKGERQVDSVVRFALEGAALKRISEVTTDTVIVGIIEAIEKYIEDSRV